MIVSRQMMVACVVCPALVLASSARVHSEQPAGPGNRAEDDDLTRRLRESATGGQAESSLQRMIHHMTLSRDLLRDQYDPGEKTQSLQKKIVDDLDQAIRQALRGMSKGQPSSQPAAGDRREKGKRAESDETTTGQGGPKPASEQSSRAAASDKAAQGRPASAPVGGDIRETAREWGNLPPRDREEVLQGVGEDVLPKYREMVEKYYRALAEQADQ